MGKKWLLIILFGIPLFAETWKERGIYHGWEHGILKKIYFSRDTNDEIIKEINYRDSTLGYSFVLYYDSAINSNQGFYALEGLSNNVNDSIWISKYWMDDNLENVMITIEKNPTLDDFRLFDSKDSKIPKVIDDCHNLSGIMDNRKKLFDDNSQIGKFNSLYFLYKKDTSYYAYCIAVTRAPTGCEFFLSCIFQDDGTLFFEEFPSVDERVLSLDGDCISSQRREDSNKKEEVFLIKDKGNVKSNILPSYNIKGNPFDKASSGIILQKGTVKVYIKN